MTTQAQKICVRCGQDCSTRPRSKDLQGRYICQDCLAKVQARAATAPAPAVPAAGDPIPLADDAAPILDAAPRACPNCGMILARAAVICTACGLNTETGRMLGTQKLMGEGRRCLKCGYDLAGLKSPRCPECGTLNTPEDRRKNWDRQESRRIARNEYIKPLVYFAISFLIVLLVVSAAGRDVEEVVPLMLLRYAVSVPVGLVVYFLCCLAWIGFDAPWRYTILRLAAAFAISDAALVLSSVVLFFGIYQLAIPVLVMGYAIHSLMDLDLTDGIIVALLLAGVQIGTAVTIAMYAQ